MTFEKNILVADEIVISKPSDAVASMRNNILYSPLGVVTLEEVVIYTSIDVNPFPFNEGNINADPKFADSSNGKYEFQSDSPAKKLGIEIKA